MTPDQWRKTIDINTTGSFLVAQAAARQMKAQKSGGSITLTASISAHRVNFPQPQASYVSGVGIKHRAIFAIATNSALGQTLTLSSTIPERFESCRRGNGQILGSRMGSRWHPSQQHIPGECYYRMSPLSIITGKKLILRVPGIHGHHSQCWWWQHCGSESHLGKPQSHGKNGSGRRA